MNSLTHILSQYDRAQRYPHKFSSHILFGQAILEVKDIVNSRISVLRKETSFLSLGRYAECDCGRCSTHLALECYLIHHTIP